MRQTYFSQMPFFSFQKAGLICRLDNQSLTYKARTRNLIRNLQLLYYAAECIDDRSVQPIDVANVSRLLEVMDRIEVFLQVLSDTLIRGRPPTEARWAGERPRNML
jgi:hypothetical protein